MDRATGTERLSNCCQFLTFDDPIQAVISDKTTSITATIASAAVEEFYRQHGRRVTENTRGCLIQLLQFEIVATHHGPPDDRLTLRIQEFKHIGCDGEGTYGNPRPIIKQDGIKQFLNELKAFRLRVSAQRADVHDRDLESSLQSQEDTSAGEDRESNVVNSQLAFATQHRNRKSAKALSGSALGGRQVQNSEVFVATKDTSPQSSRISSEEVEQNILSILEHAKEVERINSPPMTLAPSAKPQDCRAKPLNHSELLALLKKNSGNGIGRSAVSKESAQRSVLNGSAVSPNHLKDHGCPEVQAGKLIEAASIEQARNSAQSILYKSPLHHNDQEDAINEANQLDSLDILPQDMSTNTADLQFHAVVRQKSDRLDLPLPLAGAFCNEDEDDPWYGMLHIRRRDVMIPKDQQILLDRKDCWLPPEPGSRGPVANIPVPVLQTLTSMIEEHTSIASIAAVVQQDDSDCDSLSEPAEISKPSTNALGPPNYTQEDEDLPISTAEWPPSSPPAIPQVDQLPPDSSPEVTFAHERKAGKQLLRTDDPNSPSSNGKAFLGTKRSISDHDTQGQVSFQGKSNPYVPSESHKLQQMRERKGVSDMDFGIDSESDFDDCHGNSSGTEAEVSTHSAQPRTDYVKKTDDEVERGYTEFSKGLYDNDDDIEFADEQRSPGRLLPVDSDEEVFLCLPASHSQPRDNDNDGILLESTKHHSKLAKETTIAKDTEMAYSSSSDLETSAPNALCEGNMTAHVVLQRSTPMDISDSRRSTLQVYRTPYTDQDHRVKTGILPKRLVAGKLIKRHQKTEEVTGHNNMSDDDAMTEDIIPGTCSHLNSAQKPLADHYRVSHTGDAERRAPVFHGQWVPYVSEEASARATMKYGDQAVEGNIAGPARVSKHGTEESAIESLNITKRRKRTKPPKVIMIEDHQQGGDSATKSRQLHRENLENFNAQSRTSAPTPDEVPDGSGNKILDAALAEPVLPHFTHYNRGLSASQGVREVKTTCTQTPEATSSRSGTPRRDVQVTNQERNSQSKDESASLLQNMPNRLSSDHVDRLIFSSFQKAYPMYQGNEKHFVAMCRKIQTLETDHRIEHKSLWDDFIIRHQMEYRAYLHECLEQADDPIPYEKFYHTKIDEPQFSKRIITLNNLCDAISESLQNGEQMVTSLETSNGEIIGLSQGAHEPQAIASLLATKAPYMGSPDTRKSPSRDSSPVRHNLSARYTPSLQRNLSLPYSSPSQRDSPPGPQLHPQRSTPTKPATRPSPIPGTPRTAEKTPRSLPWKRKIADAPSPLNRKTKRRNVSNEATTSSGPLQAQALVYSPARNATTSRRAYPATAGPSKAATQPLEAPVQPWYLDPVNPFKSFARADASIRSGNGNAFADERNEQRAKDAKAEMENGVVLTTMKRIDVLGWEL